MMIDTNGKGLGLVFKPYQVEIINLLLKGESINSRQAWQHIQHKDVDTKSRASVINFLNDLKDEGLVAYSETTGKGGHRGIYKIKATDEKQIWQHIIAKAAQSLTAASGIKVFAKV